MERKSIPVQNFITLSHAIWAQQWFALTSGDFMKGHYNAMTVAWGSIGTMWHKPFVQVVVRPNRYTYEFMNQYPDFTLCAFPEVQRSALQILGSESGRNVDKIKKAKLTPVTSTNVGSPGFEEAELIIECEKIYWSDMNPENFIKDSIHKNYNNDYHRIYFGEIVAIQGSDRYMQ